MSPVPLLAVADLMESIVRDTFTADLSFLQCYSQSCQLLSYWPFPKCHWQEYPLGTIPQLMASGMEQWNDGIVPVK